MIFNNPYKKDFDHRPEVNGKGHFKDNFFYTGDFYDLPLSQKEKKKSVAICGLFFLGMFLCLLASGLVNQDSSHTAYVVFPYLILFLPIGYFLMGVMYYAMAPLHMNRADFEKSIRRMRYCASSAIFFTIISIFCDVIYMFRIRFEMRVMYELLYLFPQLVLLGILLLYGRYYDKVFGTIQVSKA